MKIKDGFMLREIAGQWIVIPLGERVVQFNAMMTLSESGALLWRKMENDVKEQDLIDAILSEYDIDRETAVEDVRQFVTAVKEKGLMEQEM